ncbi:MAG: CAP domain-containing protein [Gammaproteobacteria bacterium]|nr:CAP domain-containing protein [Gammaproteobacteria bacterium]
MLFATRILVVLGAITALVLMSSADAAELVKSASYLSDLEAGVLKEMNLARTEPRRYAEFLEERRRFFRGNRFERPGEIAIMTHEGVSAVDEAIAFLRRLKPVGALRPSQGMSRAARDHVQDQGPSGGSGHRGSNGSQMCDRSNRYGRWAGKIGENISYGPSDARDVVLQLIVDDGIRARGHRDNIFDPEFKVVGVACGGHSKYRAMCVMTFAAGYDEAVSAPKCLASGSRLASCWLSHPSSSRVPAPRGPYTPSRYLLCDNTPPGQTTQSKS